MMFLLALFVANAFALYELTLGYAVEVDLIDEAVPCLFIVNIPENIPGFFCCFFLLRVFAESLQRSVRGRR